MSSMFLSLNFTFRRQFMEGTSFTLSFALFNQSYLDLVRSNLILTLLFNLFLALQSIVLCRNVVKSMIILLQ